MIIKCILIEVGDDQRAVICVGEGKNGRVESTPPVITINYETGRFTAGKKVYRFKHGWQRRLPDCA